MGSRPSVESAGSGASRQLSLCPAEPFALVHRQYRYSPHPSFVQPNSLLPTAARATRLPGSRRHRPANLSSEPQVCATGAVGRRPKAPRLFPRGAPALNFSFEGDAEHCSSAMATAMGGLPPGSERSLPTRRSPIPRLPVTSRGRAHAEELASTIIPARCKSEFCQMTFEEALAQIEDPQQVPQSSRHALLLPLRTLQKAPPGAGQCRFANETYQHDAAPRSAH